MNKAKALEFVMKRRDLQPAANLEHALDLEVDEGELVKMKESYYFQKDGVSANEVYKIFHGNDFRNMAKPFQRWEEYVQWVHTHYDYDLETQEYYKKENT